MEQPFVVAKIIGSPGKMIIYFFIQTFYKFDYDQVTKF